MRDLIEIRKRLSPIEENNLRWIFAFCFILALSCCDSFKDGKLTFNEEKQIFYFDRLHHLIIVSDVYPSYDIYPLSGNRITSLSLSKLPDGCKTVDLNNLDGPPLRTKVIKLFPNTNYDIGNCVSAREWNLIKFRTDNYGRLHLLSKRRTRNSKSI